MVISTVKKPLGASLNVRFHTLSSGISGEQGGDDSGPNPHELLEASLASCTLITLQLYAARKRWEIGDTSAHVTIESENPGETVISLSLHFDRSLDDEMRARLGEIAGRCPVHKLLSSPILIKISPT